MARVFPWALNYDCGGADYPDLFADWPRLEQSLRVDAAVHLKERWRRLESSAPLLPGPYAQMLACRPENQVAGDWIVVPGARSLQWRYAVLRSAFIVCKQKVAPGETLDTNLELLLEATKKIWQRISSNTVVIDGHKKNINGNIGLLFSAEILQRRQHRSGGCIHAVCVLSLLCPASASNIVMRKGIIMQELLAVCR